MPRGRTFSYPRTSGRGQRRLSQWCRGPRSSAIQVVTAQGTTLVDTAVEATQPLTLVRVRGELVIWQAVATSIGDGFTSFEAGIGIVSADAAAQGAGSMPTPGGDADWPGWLWHHSGGSIITFETTEVLRGPMNAIRIPIDSKAMRKNGTNETLFGAVQFNTEVGTATLNFVMNTRILDKVA